MRTVSLSIIPLSVSAALLAGLGCLEQSQPPPTGPSLSVTVAPLDLPNMSDACYGLTVFNLVPAPDPLDPDVEEVVWTQADLCASVYGANGGIRFTGICDASHEQNQVRLVLNTIYSAGSAPTGTVLGGGEYVNPCPASEGGCVLPANCEPNQDTKIEFNLTIMRNANLGFFDTIVRFQDVFCAAKLDCVENDGTTPLTYLYNPATQSDGPTAVLGFACTGGEGTNVDTHIYLNDLVIICGTTDENDVFTETRRATVDPSLGPGLVTATETGAPVLFGASVNRGEGLTNTIFWNVLLGLNAFAPGEICTLTTTGTASETPLTGTPFSTPTHARYPLIRWDVPLHTGAGTAPTCTRHPLNGTLANAGVASEYTLIGDPEEFEHHLSAASFATAGCGLLGVDCPTDFACTAMHADASYDEFCWNATTDEVYVPAGSFWMGCNPVLDTDCSAAPAWALSEGPQHFVTLAGYAIDRNLVTEFQYSESLAPGSGTGSATLPRGSVNWTNARNYCQAQGKDLCTEAQWERAARGGCETLDGPCQTSMRKYPWGNFEPTCAQANFGGSGGGCGNAKSDIGAKPAGTSPYGALDMAGNVWQWTRDWQSAYPSGPVADPTGPLPLDVASAPVELYPYFKIFRGGAYGSSAWEIRSGTRYADGNWKTYPNSGWRCCRALP